MAIPKDLKDKWDEAVETGEKIPVGDLVVCDICDGDFTSSEEQGGFIFGSYAYCPKCAADALPRIKGYSEEHLIRAYCPEAMSFADFIRYQRGPDAYIRVSGKK